MTQNLRVDEMIYGGAALAHREGGEPSLEELAIPFVLPGELVQIFSGNAVSVLEPSADRIEPACVHFGSCGGCHYQHATYASQISMKRGILRDTLVAAGLEDLPEIETHAAEPWNYRNRIRLRVGFNDGELRIGYNRFGASGGDPLLPITMCPIAAPILWRAASTLLELSKTEPVVRGWLDSAVELELFTNADETKLQLTLFTRKPSTASFEGFCAVVQKAIPQLSGAGVGLLPRKPSPQGRRFEQVKPGAQWGASGLLYEVEEYSHWIGRGGFFQVNRYLVATLLQLATAGRSGSIAWDLYAGVGLFSKALTKSFATVTGVEPAEPATSSLAAALRFPHRAQPMTTLDFLQAAVVQRERPDLIVMDPPRAGVGPEVCALLARIRAPELVYVSCDPVTLARDLKLLVDGGYTLDALHMVEMFPQTFHIETVAILHR